MKFFHIDNLQEALKLNLLLPFLQENSNLFSRDTWLESLLLLQTMPKYAIFPSSTLVEDWMIPRSKHSLVMTDRCLMRRLLSKILTHNQDKLEGTDNYYFFFVLRKILSIVIWETYVAL